MILKGQSGQLCMNCMKGYIYGGYCPVCGAPGLLPANSGRALPQRYLLHGRYRIGRVLGEGGFGITYLARDEKEDCRVAVKEYMPRDLTGNTRRSCQVAVKGDPACYEKYLEVFLKEARIVNRYRDHPNIISVSHMFRENNTAYYVMEYLEGQDLGQALRKEKNGRMDWQRLRPVFSQTVSALCEIHKSGIVHCDVSPDNIILREGGQVKLIDFGAARSSIGGKSTMVMLKRGYAPPEQYRGTERLGPWTDVYALAVTIYQCLTGQMIPQSMDRLTNDPVKPPSQLGIRLPENFHEEALMRGMELQMQRRYRDVITFWTELTRPGTGKRERYLVGRAGSLEGRVFPVTGIQYAGKDESCRIRFPEKTYGVGGIHFRIWSSGGRCYLVDMGCGLPTYLERRKIMPGLVYELKAGSIIRLGDNQIFEIR